MVAFFWEYKVKRKNESSKRDLPKNRNSKTFKTKAEALAYAKDKKSNRLQATLYGSKTGAMFSVVGVIGVSGNYSEKYI